MDFFVLIIDAVNLVQLLFSQSPQNITLSGVSYDCKAGSNKDTKAKKAKVCASTGDCYLIFKNNKHTKNKK